MLHPNQELRQRAILPPSASRKTSTLETAPVISVAHSLAAIPCRRRAPAPTPTRAALAVPHKPEVTRPLPYQGLGVRSCDISKIDNIVQQRRESFSSS